MSKTITESEKLQLIGLITLGRHHQQKVTDVEQAISKLTDTEIGGHFSDSLYDTGNYDIDELLKREGVEVENATT